MFNVKLRKIIASIITAVLTFSLICEFQFIPSQNMLICNAAEMIGDANLDNKLDIIDAAFIARKVAQRRVNELPKCADHNFDDKVNIIDAASIARWVAGRYNRKFQIKFRFADQSEGMELKLANEDYFNNLSQQDLNYRMQKKDATLDEFKEFSKSQILDFTTAQKKVISETVMEIQQEINDNGYNIPLKDEIIFINTTAEDELGACGYTQKNQIYLSNSEISDYPGRLKKLISHELFHCLSRMNPQFKEDMYKIIGFSVSKDQPEFPESIKEILISNPDVEKNDAYATFTINGKKRECYMVWYLTKNFENKGDHYFSYAKTGLIPKDDLSTIYDVAEASDFWTVLGKNTEYVIAAEECIADNFSFIIAWGIDRKYESPEIIKNIDTYLKSKH